MSQNIILNLILTMYYMRKKKCLKIIKLRLKVTWVTEVTVMCYSGVYMLPQKAKAGGTMELF